MTDGNLDQAVSRKVSADKVFTAVKAIIAAGKEDQFIAEAGRHNAFVVAAPDVLSLVKSYLSDGTSPSFDAAASNLARSTPRCPPA